MPWELVQGVNTDIIVIHAALLPTSAAGDIICFGDWTNPGPTTHSRLYRVASKQIVAFNMADLPSTNAFCGGQAFLADGRLLVAGGTKAWPEDPTQMIPEKLHEHHYNGERACWIYLPRAERWERASDLNFQPASTSRGGGRWYPTLVTLANGEVFAVGGHPATGYPDPNEEDTYNGRHNNNTPERYSATADEWTLMTADITAPNGTANDSYPRFHLLPSGLLFSDTAGKGGSKRIFDPFGGVWTGQNVDVSVLPGYYSRGSEGTSVLLPLLPPHYTPRVLLCNAPGPKAYRIDVDDSPTWVETPDRQGTAAGNQRNHCCAVLLPTGQVFLSGGVIPSGQENVANTPVLTPELYTPGINWTANEFSGQESWVTVEEPASVGRGYHSVALLLPDGRVWTAGSTELFASEEKRIEIFSPSYVGQARPTIQSAPISITYGQQFQVTIGTGHTIQRVALMRCGSVTHAFDSDQRYVGLTFSQQGTTLTVISPPNPEVAPPGSYMLWVVNNVGEGCPCHLARFIRLAWQKIFISADVSTYSVQEVQALGTPAHFHDALYLVYDGFLPDEVAAPSLTIRRPDNSSVPGMTYSLSAPVYEAGSQAKDVAQRIVYRATITFTSQQAFDEIPATEDFQSVTFRATMREFTHQTTLILSKNPNPRMSDGDPHWLSVDLRAFSTRPGQAVTAGVPHGQGADAPHTYIQSVLAAYNNWNGGSPHPFDLLPTSQSGNLLPLYSEDDEGKIYNYAIARVRFRAPEGEKAEGVRVFFRLWTTGWSAMSYNEEGSHRRFGDGPTAAPLLGLTGSEINNVPCFAVPRAANMEQQTEHQENIRSLEGAGATEVHAYFGCWLDFNQDVKLFPLEPAGNGPFGGNLKSIQELMRGLHQCLVGEIHYLPDPNRPGDTPASSDNLAQRNILLDETPNPGGFGSHLVHHTFEIKPSPFPFPKQRPVGVATGAAARLHPDELCIDWGNLPRDSHVTFYLPQVDTDPVLRYASLRSGPSHLKRAGAHTLRCKVADVSFIPIPGPFTTALPGLMSVQLPPNVTKGQQFTIVVRQVDGRTLRVVGTFQFTIKVKTAQEVLPGMKRNLSVLKHIALSIPENNRWYPVFERYLTELGERIRALGEDPDQIAPSPTGSGRPDRRPEPVPGRPRATGKICELVYDCFGDFEGFVVCTCEERHLFRCREKKLEELARRVCDERKDVTVYVSEKDSTKPVKIVVHC